MTAITKEKTALVIPNAILLSTESDKYFLTSFSARDKTYLMLFRVWQNALMDQPMSAQEMWQWVCDKKVDPDLDVLLNGLSHVNMKILIKSLNGNNQQDSGLELGMGDKVFVPCYVCPFAFIL